MLKLFCDVVRSSSAQGFNREHFVKCNELDEKSKNIKLASIIATEKIRHHDSSHVLCHVEGCYLSECFLSALWVLSWVLFGFKTNQSTWEHFLNSLRMLLNICDFIFIKKHWMIDLLISGQCFRMFSSRFLSWIISVNSHVEKMKEEDLESNNRWIINCIKCISCVWIDWYENVQSLVIYA